MHFRTGNWKPQTGNCFLRSPLGRAGAARAFLGTRPGSGAALVRLRSLRAPGLARLLAFPALRLFLAGRLDASARRPPRAVGERLLAGRAVLRLELVVDQLQDGRLRRVALAGAEAQDPR